MRADSNETQPLDLWAPMDVCEALGWTRKRLGQVRADESKQFPAPAALVQNGSLAIWRAQDVRDWQMEHVDPKSSRTWRQAEALRVYRRSGVIAEAARAVGAKDDTVRAWLRKAGEVLPSERALSDAL